MVTKSDFEKEKEKLDLKAAKKKKEKKKEKKLKKTQKSEKKKKKKEKKRKIKGEDSNGSDIEKELKVKKKKAKIEESPEAPASSVQNEQRRRTRSMDLTEHGNLSDFRISETTKLHLQKRGIKALFPIQALTFNPIYDGKDLIGRARTGMGKTLAFAVPVIEKLLLEKPSFQKTAGGTRQVPRVIVLAPTRELAKQVCEDFETTAPSLKILSVYGGTPYGPQCNGLRAGVDIIVGTPGRVIDHIERGTLSLGGIKHVILDEADQMLDMGFKESMDKVFEAITAKKEGLNDVEKDYQILLFSATLPSWVDEVARKYMSPGKVQIDLVKGNDAQASVDVRHIAVPSHWTTRAGTINDLISIHGGNKSATIVFCETKKECNELGVDSQLTYENKVLHGDVPQNQREIVLKGFKEGKFRVLIATDVAARGLDMRVDLVINGKPPMGSLSGRADTETYVHRSGRTGRAGRKGICVTLYTPKHRPVLQEIEKRIKNKFEWAGAPQPIDIVAAGCDGALEDIEDVDDQVFKYFDEHAKKLIKEMGAEEALCAALAVITGHTKPLRSRSLLSNSEGFETFQFKSDREISAKGYVWGALRRVFEQDVTENIKGMTISADKYTAVFDVPEKHIKSVKSFIGEEPWLSKCTELPELEIIEVQTEFRSPPWAKQKYGNSSGRGFSRGQGERGGRGRGRGRGRDFSRGRRGRGRGRW